jgi:LmbE family N-acetylglucosaminyl deacetylase
MKVLFLAPHNDDEALFGAYTIMRRKPIVVIVTDSWIQFGRGQGITAKQRRQETIDAMNLLCAPVEFLGIRDNELDNGNLISALQCYSPDKVYAPQPNSKNVQHNLVGEIAHQLWNGKVIFYSTYTTENLTPKGKIEIVPKPEEIEMKNRALDCYKSQIRINNDHFVAVRGKSEYLNDPRTDKVSAVLVKWKRSEEIQAIVDWLKRIEFIDEVIVWENKPEDNKGVYARYLAAIRLARNELIYTQDDDCVIENIREIYTTFDGRHLSNGIKPARMKDYGSQKRDGPYITLVGWGAFFKRDWVSCFDPYLRKYGEDSILYSMADRVFTFLLARKHNTIEARVRDFPSATGPMAMHLQPNHQNEIAEVKKRLRGLAGSGAPAN